MRKIPGTRTLLQPLLFVTAAGVLSTGHTASADSAADISPEQRKALMEQLQPKDFSEADANNDNVIDWKELDQAYDQELSAAGLTEAQLFGDLDLNQDQALDQVEYHAFTTGLVERQEYSAAEIGDRNDADATTPDQQEREQDQAVSTGVQAGDNEAATEGEQQKQSAQAGDGSVEAIVGVTEIQQVPVKEIADREVISLDDKKIGEVEDVVMTEDGAQTALVVSTGGFLGIGGKVVVIDVDEVHFTGEQVVWERMGEDASVDDLPEYNKKDYVSIR